MKRGIRVASGLLLGDRSGCLVNDVGSLSSVCRIGRIAVEGIHLHTPETNERRANYLQFSRICLEAS